MNLYRPLAEKYSDTNATPHNRSVSRPTDTNTHATILNGRNFGGVWGIRSGQQGEAADLLTYVGGVAVVGPFDGKVIYSNRHSTPDYGYYAILRSNGKRALAVLAHIDRLLPVGTKVRGGKGIARTSKELDTPRLHFELWLDDNPVHAGRGASPKEVLAAIEKAIFRSRRRKEFHYTISDSRGRTKFTWRLVAAVALAAKWLAQYRTIRVSIHKEAR